MPTTLTNGIQLPDKGSVDWYGSMQSNYNLIDTHLGDTDVHVTAEDKANWNSKQGSLSQAQLDAIAQVATNTSDIATLQSGKANASHTHSSSDITDIDDYATKQYVDSSISGLVDSAPAALDTLKELSTALNDDANFASTVTTALAAKANSADLATVATSGSYNDLSNKPTINDSTITIQKNGSTVDTFTTNGSNKTINIPVPTKTSDLTNDSNFVDTSNSAVSSGITSAKVTDYDTHIADTNIHVTTADKQKWNNGVSQAYVLRYASTSVTPSSTISYSVLNNTDNIKAGDSVIDSSGQVFLIASVDSVNQTVTVSAVLLTLALDANVMHLSGNETASGVKTFSSIGLTGYPSIRMYLSDDEWNVLPATVKQSEFRFTDKNSVTVSYFVFQHRNDNTEPFRTCWRQQKMDGTSGYFSVNFNNLGDFYPENNNVITLGKSANKWKGVYATNYYYGVDNVEFSDKFVTTDTSQTITGSKVFDSTPTIYNSDTSRSTTNLYFRNQLVTKGDNSSSGNQTIRFSDANDKMLGRIQSNKISNGTSSLNLRADSIDTSNNDVVTEVQILASRDGSKSLSPQNTNDVDLGRTLAKWKNLYINQINGLTPSSLSMPSGNLNDIIDISGYLVYLDGTANTYTAPDNGWISITVSGCSGIQAYINGLWGNQIVRPSVGAVRFLVPVIKNLTVNILIYGGAIDNARFIPCQGNV